VCNRSTSMIKKKEERHQQIGWLDKEKAWYCHKPYSTQKEK
jgi:hypothetical protein